MCLGWRVVLQKQSSNQHMNRTYFSMAEFVYRFTLTQIQPLKNTPVILNVEAVGKFEKHGIYKEKRVFIR